MKAVARACLCGVLTMSCAAAAFAQEAKSATLAKQLAAALDAGKLDSIAAKDPSSPDTFIGALYFKGNVTEPGSKRSFPIHGALLQNLNVGYGYFLGSSESGRAVLGP